MNGKPIGAGRAESIDGTALGVCERVFLWGAREGLRGEAEASFCFEGQ